MSSMPVNILLSLKKTINDNAADTRLLSRVTYDEMGQMKEKQLGQKQATDNSAMELQQYDYNIRGWLAGINKDYTEATSTVPGANTAWFGMKLNYDNGFEFNQYNGNIAGTVWRSRGDGAKRAYGFGYDRLNRLLFADFNQLAGSSWDKSAGIDFTSLMGDGKDHHTAYDANGNILRMQQWGLRLNQSVQIDDLSYDYFGSSNKLKSVFDAMNDPTTTLGDFRTASGSPNFAATNAVAKTDYAYDVNGNLLKDLNKEIGGLQTSGIQYNHLNLPYQVAVTNKGTITYIYDASGRKLEKQTLDNTAQGKTTKTAYIGGYVFQDDVLQFIGNEEGRARPKDNGFVFDYFIKDHLGNTRVVLTDEEQTDAYPVASMETAQAGTEKLYYMNLDETRTDKPAGYPEDSYTNPNDKVARLNGNGQKIGPAMILKVMSGDRMNIRANVYYRLNGSGLGAPTNPAGELLTALASSLQTVTGGKFGTQQIQSSGVLGPGISDLLQRQSDQYAGSTRPKAYLNWVLLDEQFKIVNSSTGFEQVGADTEFKTFVKTGLPITQNGYLYVYTSNESPVDIYFDNLQLTHVRGPLLEESHYYPFGMTMSGISAKSAGKPENKFKYNGKEKQDKEFSDGTGLEWYDYGARMYDQQIGRWNHVDPLNEAARRWSPFTYAYNNPLLFIDPDGMFADYYDRDGVYLGNDGVDDNKVYQLKSEYIAKFDNKSVNWGGELSEKHSAELKQKSNDLGVVQELKLIFEGDANEKNPKQADGKLNVIQVVSGGKELTRASFDAVGGPWGNGSPENGNYTVNTLLDRGPDGWYNEGMTKEGVGFSLNVNPQFKTGRSLLRIHPDGGKFFGTQGCIGLTCGKEDLLKFKGLMQKGLSIQKAIALTVNILNNPNNNGYGKKVKSNGE